MIDLTKTYKIEQKINTGDLQGLDKEGLSRHVGTMKQIGVAYNETTKKFKTGLDEHAPEVIKLPTKEREEKVAWILETRKNLETLIGSEGILNPTNEDFWGLWSVNIEVGQDKKLKVFGQHPFFTPSLHWQHALALITIDANDSLPLTKKDSGNPKYKDSQFYITTTEEEVTFSKDKIRQSRERAKFMDDLFSGTGKFERASRIAYLMNIQKEPVGIEKLEEILEIFTAQPEYLPRFLELCKLEDSELELRTTIKKAIDYDVIQFNGADKIYFRGGFNMRSTEDSTVGLFKANISEPTIAREYAEIKAAVLKKDGKRKQKQLV